VTAYVFSCLGFEVWAARKIEREKNGKKQKKVDIVFVTNLNTSGG
jgi:hypothetical protein